MNQLVKLLEHWLPKKDQFDWVLATIVATDGSTYRKPGAMMLINSMGQYFGLLSGGCLEADIMRQARQCWDSQQNRLIEYDMREEDDLAWQLGLGCGGMVRILLQPIVAVQDYLHLTEVYQALSQDKACGYSQVLDENTPNNQLLSLEQLSQQTLVQEPSILLHHLTPPLHLVVFGGGVDARPVVALAATLGWQVTLCDPRIANGRVAYFSGANRIVREPIQQLDQANWFHSINAALIMTHSIDLDGQAIKLLQLHSVQHNGLVQHKGSWQHQPTLQYMGLLGPLHRTDIVLARIGLTKQQLSLPLANPVGLRLGGDLPESIALSMIAEVHSFLHQADGQSISEMLNQVKKT